TSSHQTPKQDWLNSVVTSKAKTKIRQLLKEEAGKQVDIAKETLSRRMKNRKIELDDSHLMQLIKKLRYKTVTDCYVDIANGKNDITWVSVCYIEFGNKGTDRNEVVPVASDGGGTLKATDVYNTERDELIMYQNVAGID